MSIALEGMEEIIKEFLVESGEGLDLLDRDLVALERDPTAGELLAEIFRAVHTIKGTSGVLGFSKIESVAHVGENLLSRMRDGTMVLNPAITSGLLAMVDALRRLLGEIEQRDSEGDADYSQVVRQLEGLLAGVAAVSTPASGAISPSGAQPEISAAGSSPAAAAVPAAAPAAAAEPAKESGVASSNVRVDVGLLDKMMNLVGELVLARNQIVQCTGSDATFLSAAQRLNLITSELQEAVMKTRMQPIGNIWSKFPRLVRDLALQCGKQATIAMDGAETELDKTIIEAVKDPLTHILRNSLDHGIEAPERRVAVGKPPGGRLHLRAYHEGGQVNIEISDDGAGINLERVKQKALQRGLITPGQAARMGERELANLVFQPGFTTAEKVSNVSGRGVGLDVVKTNIEKIGGGVELLSTSGEGITLKIRIPLTLAIIPALLVTSGGERFAIPQVSLLELVRLEGEQGKAAVEQVQDVPVYRLRGRLLPLVFLNRELGLEGGRKREDVDNIVVLRAGDGRFGLVVDEIDDSEEIVVKPLGKQLKGIACLAGATILGDGQVALILDVLGMAEMAGVASGQPAPASEERAEAKAEEPAARQSWLLFRSAGGSRLALPLPAVARLEEFPRQRVERCSGEEAVQYRGEILRLVRMSQLLGEPEGTADPLRVVVLSGRGQSAGLVVDRIEDITDEAVKVREQPGKGVLLGSAVIQQKVTDIVDLRQVMRQGEQAATPVAAGRA